MKALVYALFLLSGATGLVYEVAWGKYLALFFGSTALAHTVVLSVFMGGLALGNWWLGRVADRVSRQLSLYGLLELGVGLLCLLFPLMATAVSHIYTSLASSDCSSPRNLALKLALCLVALLPPTILMGGSLPALSRFFVRSLDGVGRGVGALYFVNSAGAALGCLAGGFWLIGTLGLDTTMFVTAVANIALGAACLWLGQRPSALADTPPALPAAPSPPATGQAAFTVFQQRTILALVFVSGALSMLYELAWIRLLALAFGSSTYSFSLMLFSFIAGIATGAFVASALTSRGANPFRLFALAELGIFGSLAIMLPLYERLPFWFNILASHITREPQMFPVYLGAQVAMAFALMVIPATLIGMTLPLAAIVVTTRLNVLGATVGSVFSINTLGNVLGSALTGFVLLPALGIQTTFEAGVLASGLVGIVALLAWLPAGQRRSVVATAMGVLVVWVAVKTVAPRWGTMVMNAGVYRIRQAVAPSYADFKSRMSHETVLYYHNGPDMSVAVGHTEQGPDHLWLNVNGKTDATTDGDMGTQLLVAHIPLLLRPDAQDVLVVGLGSGVTVGAVLKHPVRSCEVVEISEAVVEGSRFFDRVSGAPLDDPRTHLSIADAKEYLQLRRDARYDLIISEPSNPWIAGIGNLFSVEFFREAVAHLRQGGVFVQWMHLYEMDDPTLAIALNSLSSVFPTVTVWHPQGNDIMMVATMSDQHIRLDVLDSLLSARGIAEQLANPLVLRRIGSAEAFLGLQVLSPARFKQLYPGTPPFNSDRHPLLEHRAPRAFFVGGRAEFLGLEERVRTRWSSDLMLARELGDATLDSTQLMWLGIMMGAPRYPTERRLLRGIVTDYVNRFGLDSAATDSTQRIMAVLAQRFGVLDNMRTEDSLSTQALTGTMSPQKVREYWNWQADRLRETSSVFVTPDTTAFAFAHRLCIASIPAETARYESRRTALWKELGLDVPRGPVQTEPAVLSHQGD